MTALRLVQGGGFDGGLTPLERWELEMRGAGQSERTIRSAHLLILRIQRVTGKTIDQLQPIDISRFLADPRLKLASKASYFGSFAAFFKWYGNNGGTNITAGLPRPKAPRGTPRPVTDVQVQDLFAVRMRKRTRVMIQLAVYQGLRVSEIARVRGEDVDPIGRTLRVLGKGNRVDTLPLHQVLVDAATTMPRKGWWFPGNSRRPGQPIRSRGVADIISQAMDRAGIPGGTAHRLRHWYGTKLVAQGTDLRTAQALLRHANLNTTSIYVAVSDTKRTEAIDRLDPFSDGEDD